MAFNWTHFIGLTILIWIITTIALAPLISLSFTSFWMGLVFSIGVLLFLKIFFPDGIIGSAVPLTSTYAALIGIVLIIFSTVGFSGFFGMMQGSVSGTGMEVPSFIIPEAVVTTPAGTAAACAVSPEILGTTATATVNAYDYEANSPLTSSVDTAYNVYDASSWSIASMDNFVQNSGDSTSGSIATLKAGHQYTFLGNQSTSYYVEPNEGVCMDGQQKTVNIKAHAILSETNLASVGYDDTGATALTAATHADYTVAVGASEEKTFYWKLKNNVANKAYYMCAVGTLALTNTSTVNVYDENGGAIVTQATTPLWLKDVSVGTNSTGGATLTRTYTVWKLNTPVLLEEFESKKFMIKVKATANEPAGVDAAGGFGSGFAAIGIDCQYNKGDDGKVYFDIYDHTATEADSGMAEVPASPLGLTGGMHVGFT